MAKDEREIALFSFFFSLMYHYHQLEFFRLIFSIEKLLRSLTSIIAMKESVLLVLMLNEEKKKEVKKKSYFLKFIHGDLQEPLRRDVQVVIF